MSNCYICEQKITSDNIYNEHIVLNSIGGRLTSEDIMCKICAKDLDPLDSALYKPLHPIANLLDIKRDRKKTKDFKAELIEDKREVSIAPGGKPKLTRPYIVDEIDQGGKLSIDAPNEKMMRQALKGLRRKYPELSDDKTEQFIQGATKEKEPIGKVKFDISFNDDCLRAICKMAMGFYIYHGGERKYIAHLIPYLKRENEEKINVVHHYYPSSDKIHDYLEQDEKITHCLFIKGDSQNKCLYGFIQLFGTFQFLILLSNDYQGEDLCKSYIFDVLARTEIKDNLELTISQEEIKSIQSTSLEEKATLLFSNMENASNKLLSFIYEKQFLDGFRTHSKPMINSEVSKLEGKDILTDEDYRNLVNALSQNFTEYLVENHYI